MLGWSIAFFVAAMVAAVFGYGHVASTFAGIAIILFWIFLALFVISLIFGLVGGGTIEGRPYVSNGVPALVLIAGLAVLAYAWVKNDWSAQDVGRAIDHGAARVTADAGQAIHEAGDRAKKVGDDTKHDLTHPSDHRNE
ncbi:MAG: DUF1328 domain-containing protein [Alphaproteobacteria bacterium]